jgi:DAK2 domain fusion protein YloV
VLEQLDASGVRRWCELALGELTARRQEIDDLNVYPVPDGDTGTNLVLTFEAATGAVLGSERDLASTMRALARAALLGARGNSGVILSQLLRGISDVFADAGAVTGAHLQEALRRAADLAYAAVAQPVEGTILTVARAASELAATADPDDLCAVVRAAAKGAAEALARTPELLPILRDAGVVDAGGQGLCVVLDALATVITGDLLRSAPPAARAGSQRALVAAREMGSDEFQYEVQFLLDATDEATASLRSALAPLGDSLVIVGGDGLYNVHVHVNDIGSAIEAAIEAGRPHRVSVTRFADQIEAAVPTVGPSTAESSSHALSGRAVVAVVPGAGLAELFRAAGAVVVTGGATMNPSTGEILDAIGGTQAREVVVLPNEGNVQGAAAQAAAESTASGRDVHVIPTRSPVQGLAALAVHDPDRSFADDAIAMTRAAGATRFAEVTIAVRDAQTSAGPCAAGDVLGLVGGDVAIVGSDVADVGCALVDRLAVAGGELLTVVAGDGCGSDVTDALLRHVATEHPLIDVEVHQGGQPHYPLLLGLE